MPIKTFFNRALCQKRYHIDMVNGDPAAEKLLGQLLFWEKSYHKRYGIPTPFYLSTGEINFQTGLTESRIRTARQKLLDADLISYEVKSVRGYPRSYYTIKRANYIKASFVAKARYRAKYADYFSSAPMQIAAPLSAPTPPTSAPTNIHRPAYKSTSKTTTVTARAPLPPTPPPTSAPPKPQGGRGCYAGLVIPKLLQTYPVEQIEAHLPQDPEAAQQLLFALKAWKGVENPLRGLRSLRQLQDRGALDTTGADAIAKRYAAVKTKPTKPAPIVKAPEGEGYQDFCRQIKDRHRTASQRQDNEQNSVEANRQLAYLQQKGLCS